ncbi:MAG: UDP-N-acetylbacillosamine N-acetyltransferase [Bacteroidetes bacterium ADurb.Bin041]|nr:MAG: UDP-N-acetylbacillosamine N-acetyltransferase [Bacteroidetes bacterium ADurb.Bin041]
MDDIVIIGSGGLAKEIAEYIDSINESNPIWNLLGYSTNNPDQLGIFIHNYKIFCLDEEIDHWTKQLGLVIGVGFPNKISEISAYFNKNLNLYFPNIILPTAFIAKHISLDKGNIITPGVVISTDVQIGSYNLFNWNVTIGHDTLIGNCNVFNPGSNISGNIILGSRVLVGTGSQILQGLTICDDVIIGAGAVVTKDIKEPGTYVGIPARRIK